MTGQEHTIFDPGGCWLLAGKHRTNNDYCISATLADKK
jgi:hypothetical protein